MLSDLQKKLKCNEMGTEDRLEILLLRLVAMFFTWLPNKALNEGIYKVVLNCYLSFSRIYESRQPIIFENSLLPKTLSIN